MAGRTEETRRAKEMVCCARVMVAVCDGGLVEAFDDGGMCSFEARSGGFRGCGAFWAVSQQPWLIASL